MYEESATRSQVPQSAESSDESESPLPNVPFGAIAVFLGVLVLVLLAAAAYSLAESLAAIAITPQLLGPAVFTLLVAVGLWAVSRYRPRTHTR